MTKKILFLLFGLSFLYFGVAYAQMTLLTPCTASINATPSSVTSNPASVTLQWDSDACNNLSVTGIGTVPPAGSRTVSVSFNQQSNSTTFCIYGADQVDGAQVKSIACTTVTYSPPSPATITVHPCTEGGSWVISPGGYTGTSNTVYPDPSGTNYTLSYTLSGYTATISPPSLLLYPNGSGDFSVTCNQINPPKVISFSASPTSLQCTDPLSSATLSWTSQYATSCTISGDWSGTVPANGSQTITPSGSTSGPTTHNYSIQCFGDGGGSPIVSTSLTVGQCTAPQATLSLSASPSSISSGGASTLSWSGKNLVAGSCSAWWTPSTATSGTQSVSPSVTTDYSITCTRTAEAGGGTITSNPATVTVTPGPTVSVSASPSTISSGQSSTISWSSTNATSCSAPWTTSTATSGTQNVSPTQTTSYSMTCSGAGGSGYGSATVTVSSNPPPTVSVSANPSTISSGQSSTISWSSSNATSCSAPWTSSTATSGTQAVSPSVTTTYTMTCSGAGGSGSGSAVVNVGTQPYSFDYNLSKSGDVVVTKDGGNVYGNVTITRTAISGTQAPVTLAITSALPSGVTAVISNNPCTANPTCNSTIVFTVTQGAQTGTFTVPVTGTATNGPTKTINVYLTINPSASVTVSCSASPSPATVGAQVTWSAIVSGGVAPYTYSWSGTNFPTAPAPSTNPFNFIYQSAGSKTAQVTVRDNNGAGSGVTCNATQLQVNVKPSFNEF